MSKAVTFKIRNREYTLSKQDVEKALKETPPEKVHTYYVKIGSEKYPVKQALAQTLKIGKSTFITTDAHRQLEKMGFEVGCTLYGD